MNFKLKSLINFSILLPFLLSFSFVVFFYSNNQYLFNKSEVFYSIIIIFILGIFLHWVLELVVEDQEKIALILSIIIFGFFAFGFFYGLLRLKIQSFSFAFFNIHFTNHAFAILLTVSISILTAMGAFFIFKTKRGLHIPIKVLSITTLFIITTSLSRIAAYEFQSFAYLENNSQLGNIESTISRSDDTHLNPDIYYIILDAYSHESTLRDIFNFSNADFYEYLKEKNFYIVNKSRSNYFWTMLSLPSSLNMRYIDRYDSEATLVYLISNNEVQQFLKEKGYIFINLNSGFNPTAFNKQANLNFTPADFLTDSLSKFHLKNQFLLSFLLETTALKLISDVSPYPIKEITASNSYHSKMVMFNFEKLKEISKLETDRPKFVFSHIIAPHPPYTLDENCNRIKKTDFKSKPHPYIKQLICVNKEVEKVVDTLIGKSENPPVIILQSDHGITDEFTGDVPVSPESRILKNFIALHLPGEGDKGLYPSMTPVNLFRLIFNHYFNADYKLLPDRSYFPIEGDRRYFTDVTDKVKF